MDTGSTVSTVSSSFYQEHLPQKEIRNFDSILELHCADGSTLPYQGYIEVNINAPGLQNDKSYPCIFLVVDDTAYHQTVPLLIGTNILKVLMEDVRTDNGVRYLQGTQLQTPWYLAFRCLSLRDKELSRKEYKLGIVKSAETSKITIPPNSRRTVNGYIDRQTRYHDSCAMLQATTESAIPQDLDIVPTVVTYKYGQQDTIPVHICNITTRTVTVSPKALLCELQAVNIEELPLDSDSKDPQLDSIHIDTGNVTLEQYGGVREFIEKNKDLFSWHDTDIGHVTTVEHHIELLDETPFKQRPRRIPPAMYQEVRDHLQQLIDAGIIRKSKSPFSSNVVLCRKKNNELRMCVDYRQLNNRTKKDAYALPIVEQILENLSGNSYFTVLDAKSGYHQVNIKEAHKERTAFTVGPMGFYEYNRMPFGLSNSPATYQRLMEECLGDLHLSICFIFLDDLIIFSRTYEEHMERLQMVFDRLRVTGLKLSPKKCNFLMERVKYVGHVVSKQGIETDPDKTERIKNWPTPKTPEEVRQFLGFCGYYRRFIRNFSQIAKPLTILMPIPKDKQKGKKIAKQKWVWGTEQNEAFEKLKHLLATPPILGFPNYSMPFELHTDASGLGLGAVLYQMQEGKKRVISYASRGLTKSERNYPAHKMEFLALKWAVTEKFRDYLYGHAFTVYTDNNPLTYVLTTAKLDATGHRWLSELANFEFNIIYRPGRNGQDADALSRMQDERELIGKDSVKAICHSIYTEGLVDSITMDTDVIDRNISGTELSDTSNINWRQRQDSDPMLDEWKYYVRTGRKPKMDELIQSPDAYAFLKNFNSLIIEDGVLYRQTKVNGEDRKQLVLPKYYTNSVLEQLHNKFGHPGRERTMSLIRDRFYWSGMFKDCENWIKNCQRCVCRKTPTNQCAPLINIETTYPLELVCMDYLTLEQSKGGYQHILVITDHFTRFAQAIPTRNSTAKTTADALFNHFITYYGIPTRIHSDRGAQFEGNIIRELCNITGMTKSRTTPYHAMGNGMTERFNRSLLDMLGTLEPHQKPSWKPHVAPLVHAYNCTRHESTDQSPYYLMFGREPRLPIDLAFGINNQHQKTLTKYVEDLRNKMKRAYEIATSAAAQARTKQKEGYDVKARGSNIKEGDRVLVKIVVFDGKHKISDRWEEDIYQVVRQPNPKIPVYVVQKENGEGRKRTLHRNLLLPIGHLDGFQQPEATAAEPKKAPVPNRPATNPVRIDASHTQDLDATSDSEDDYQIEVPVPDAADTHIPQDVLDTADDESQEGTDVGDAQLADVTDTVDTEEHQQPSADDDASHDDVGEGAGAIGNTPEEDTELVDDEDDDADEPPRRSTRQRTQPSWMTSGEFVQSVQPRDKEKWKEKYQCLQSLLISGACKGHEQQVINAMIEFMKQ